MRHMGARLTAALLIIVGGFLPSIAAAEVARTVVDGDTLQVLGDGTTTFALSQLEDLNALYNATKYLLLQGIVLPEQPFPDEWRNFSSLSSLTIDCAPAVVEGAKHGSTFGTPTQLESLKGFIEYKQGQAIASLTIRSCSMAGDFGTIWHEYLSGVKLVNLTDNALTGGVEGLDAFDSVCPDDWSGDDYDDPDCDDPGMYVLDVSHNDLNGSIGTGAALGDDVTDAICSVGCMSLLLDYQSVDDPRVVCKGHIVIHAQGNPGLDIRHRGAVSYASGYVIRDRANWCFEPSSRWVLPTTWGIFLAMMFSTLALTLYARFKLRRLPFRMKTPIASFGALGSLGRPSSNGGAPAVAAGHNGPSLATSSAGMAGAYAKLRGSSEVELSHLDERQAMIPKGKGQLVSDPTLLPTAYQESNGAAADPAAVAVSIADGSANGNANGNGWPRGKVQSPEKPLKVALVDKNSSSSANGAYTPGPYAAELAEEEAQYPWQQEQQGWGAWIKRQLCRFWDMLWMELRCLFILGMFGLECYWAYNLILVRGGWQLLLLIPNYLENTLGGIAMLRAIMHGTHGKWKYVAAVPLLPFLMSSLYMVYGFILYPFGFADLPWINISWEKFLDLMDSCGVVSSTCWAIFSSLCYWEGNSVSTSYQYFNTDIFIGMMVMCFIDLLSTAHHLANTLQIPFKQWLRKEMDVRLVQHELDKSHNRSTAVVDAGGI